jgi:hypothetical protein
LNKNENIILIKVVPWIIYYLLAVFTIISAFVIHVGTLTVWYFLIVLYSDSIMNWQGISHTAIIVFYFIVLSMTSSISYGNRYPPVWITWRK